MEDYIVEISGNDQLLPGGYLKCVVHEETGEYFYPIPLAANLDIIKELKPAERFIKVAVIDTGVLSNHPMIRQSLIDFKDFTGEGAEDLSGHGTMVALIMLANSPGM